MGSRRRGVTATSAEGTDFPDIPGAIGETGKPARPTRVGDNSRILRLALGSSPACPFGVGYDVFPRLRDAWRPSHRDGRQPLALRSSGVGDYCIGERDSIKPPGFDFGNSPAELRRAEVAGKTLIQTTTNGTAGITAARGADRIYAGALVTAEATVRAILRNTPAVITLVAMGRSNGTIRADEDELCALYLCACLEGRQPDVAAIRAVLATMPPPPNPKPVTAGAYELKHRENAAEVDAIAFAISVRLEGGLLIAEAERNDLQPAS
jgi:2-phosphosulfolactate phosphatase